MKRIFLTILVLFIFLLPGGRCFCFAAAAGAVGNNGLENDSARQLRIYRDALMQGASEQSRIDAAIELLRGGDSESRAVLLEGLVGKNGESVNAAARDAVCKALITCRAWRGAVSKRNDFLEPLFGILVGGEGAEAKLAAEALLLFDYSEISDRLKTLVFSGELGSGVRLNLVYALEMRTEPDAIGELVKLLDDSDAAVAAAAGKALQSWVPVGTDRVVWQGILRELKRKSPVDIIKERMVTLQQQMGVIKSERDEWKKLYFSALDREFDAADDVNRGKLVFDKLGSGLGDERLWAVGKVGQFSSGVVLPEGFAGRLMGLLSDPERSVRLGTAKVFSRRADLNPADKLLERLKVEQDQEVGLAIFEALGEACYYAFSPNSQIKLDIAVRLETMEWAGRYIVDSRNGYARQGAEVLRKLLELGGLDEGVVNKYLGQIAGRYEEVKGVEGPLGGNLLSVMARLCSPDSACRAGAVKLFGGKFSEALAVSNSAAVRRAGVEGMKNVDKAEAFKIFKERGLVDDGSGEIRKTVIELAGELGGEGDLGWLGVKLGANGDGEAAWRAMRDVLQRQEAGVVASWAGKVGAVGGDKVRELLELAEKKAEGQKDAKVLQEVREQLLGSYLEKNEYDKVGRVVGSVLAVGDVAEGGAVLSRLGGFFGSGASDEAKKALFDVLAGVKYDGKERPNWQGQLKVWQGEPVPKAE